jgi:hypothetical protein
MHLVIAAHLAPHLTAQAIGRRFMAKHPFIDMVARYFRGVNTADFDLLVNMWT